MCKEQKKQVRSLMMIFLSKPACHLPTLFITYPRLSCSVCREKTSQQSCTLLRQSEPRQLQSTQWEWVSIYVHCCWCCLIYSIFNNNTSINSLQCVLNQGGVQINQSIHSIKFNVCFPCSSTVCHCHTVISVGRSPKLLLGLVHFAWQSTCQKYANFSAALCNMHK